MRDILFKAKRIDNGEWVYWNIFGELCRESGKRTRISIKKDATTSYYDYIYQIITLIDKNTICQYTGVTDKNGNKIWENDVISTDCGNVRVIYSNDPSPYENSFYVGFEVIFENITDNENHRHDLGYWIKFRGFEVIGNIFDNPELIGE